MKFVSLGALILTLAITSVVAILFPQKIQNMAIKSHKYEKMILPLEFFKSKNYLIFVRAFGVIALLLDLFLLWMIKLTANN